MGEGMYVRTIVECMMRLESRIVGGMGVRGSDGCR